MSAADPIRLPAAVVDAPSAAGGLQTVTLVLTDVAGSTRLWADHPDAMSAVMGRHHQIVHGAVVAYGGWRPVDQGEGDAVFAAFDSATSAVAAVVRFQRELAAEPWPAGIQIAVRVSVHTGEVTARDGNLFGSTVNRCARLRGLGAGGQVLLSAPTWELVRDRLPDGVSATDLGEHRMKDLTRPEHVHQLLIPGLPNEFPPLASLDRAQHNLPIQTSSFLGRDREVAELVDLVGRERLVTITGFGGMGKTRLALQAAAELAVGDGDGVWFVDLSAETDPERIPSLIATTLGIAEGTDGPLPALLTGLTGKRLLLILDNLEQLLPHAAATVDRLLNTGPELRVLVTSREPLRLQGEQTYALPSLPVPPPPRHGAQLTEAELGSLSTYAAVALFIARAAAARRDFALTAGNAPAIAAICARLDGLPLALELAAARTRLLSPEALLPRLDQALKILTGGNRNLPTRHQTLRATIAWSYDALAPDEQRLLDRLSIFPGSFTLEAAEAICGPGLTPDEDDLDVLEEMSVLVDRSLVRLHPATGGQTDDRYSLLVSIRDYAVEQLLRLGQDPVLASRHLAYYTELTVRAPDWTPEDRDKAEALTRAELHNLRSALQAAHTSGTAEQEVELAAALVRSRAMAGLLRECTDISDRALSRGGPLTRASVVLLFNVAAEHINAGTDRTRSLVEQTLKAARELGDLSLVAAALTISLRTSSSRSAARESIIEVQQMIDRLPPDGNHPRWVVKSLFDNALGNMYYVEPGLALEVCRRLVIGETSLDLVLEKVNLCEALLRCGLLPEAESAAAELETSPDLVKSGGWFQSFGMLTAAQVRLTRGGTDTARSDLERVRSTIDELGLPKLAVWADVLEAGIARLAGQLPAAREVLFRVVERPPVGVDPADLARARWLFAVTLREIGDISDTTGQLELAWRDVAGSEVFHLDLILECLLERAVQLVASDPAEAVRLIGLVTAHRGSFAFVDGVHYETDAMLDDLRSRIGHAEVDRILAETIGKPLPNSPTWDYVDDSEVKG